MTELFATSNWFAVPGTRNRRAPVPSAKPPFSTKNRNVRERDITVLTARLTFETCGGLAAAPKQIIPAQPRIPS
jgi:hypothetical protein